SSSSPFISERPIDQPRPLKLIYIGAGISGIVAAIQFLKAVPHLELTIYEKNPELGGTWFENRYPGCACDVPSHTYQLSSESWTEWSHFFSGSEEILEYWKRVAQKYNVRKHILFNRRCVEARWHDTTSSWTVQVQDVLTENIFEDSADVLMIGTGLLNEWKWPSVSGLQSFKGQLLHSASWDESFDLRGKNIAVIGSGSTAVQIVPAIIDKVKSMDHYVHGKHRPVDAIICATGFEKNLGGNFPIIGCGGSSLRDRYANRPETYLGLCTDGFPNFFQSLGPNSFQGAGNLLIMIEHTHAYVAQILSRMAYGNVGQVEPKRRQVLNFTNYAEKYFERTVYSSECNSWYKSPPPGATTLQQRKKGRVTALWPGSSLHAIKALEHVRWEDFETTAYDGNEFG
ncbi:hypothetical protein ASPNIDRAFT_139537, partial [Aspergillus niger ATCC 1015]